MHEKECTRGKIWGMQEKGERKNPERAIWGAGDDKGRGKEGRIEEWRGKMRKGEIGEGSESARVGFFGEEKEKKKKKKRKKKNSENQNGEKKKKKKKKEKIRVPKGAELIGIVTRL